MRLSRTDLELEVIVNRVEGGEVDLQPDFQRGEVWNSDRQRRLVDTILRNWYIPPIHLIRDTETGTDLVLDGQQRLAAVLAFFRDDLTVNGRLSPPDEEIEPLHGLLYSGLPDDLKRRVRRFPLSVVTLTDYEPEEPYELFFRLNQHMTLTPPEKRNALYGPARDQVKEVIDELIEGGLLARATVGFANRRLAYDDVLARFALTVQLGTLRRSYSNRDIEAFYRTEKFSEETITSVFDAARTFLGNAGGMGLKLNKATLLSWLVFTYSLGRNDKKLQPEFVKDFETLRGAIRVAGERIDGVTRSIITVFNDRASYRVNDTLSILLRDLSLHLVWSLIEGHPSDDRIGPLVSTLDAGEGPPDPFMVAFLNDSGWDLPK